MTTVTRPSDAHCRGIRRILPGRSHPPVSKLTVDGSVLGVHGSLLRTSRGKAASMYVARRMSARASTALALRAYRAKKACLSKHADPFNLKGLFRHPVPVGHHMHTRCRLYFMFQVLINGNDSHNTKKYLHLILLYNSDC